VDELFASLVHMSEISSFEQALFLFLAGACGAFVRDICVNDGCLELPLRIERKDDGGMYVHLGFLASLIMGGAVGVIVDQSIWTAFSSAIIAPMILEQIINSLESKFWASKGDESAKPKGGEK
jgi:hypothetical protein